MNREVCGKVRLPTVNEASDSVRQGQHVDSRMSAKNLEMKASRVGKGVSTLMENELLVKQNKTPADR